jgi:hypothetical protein
MNPPYVKTFEGGLMGTAGGTTIAPGVPNSAVDATAAANQSFASGFLPGELSCAAPQANPEECLPPVAITAVPNGEVARAVFPRVERGRRASDRFDREAFKPNTSGRAPPISHFSPK